MKIALGMDHRGVNMGRSLMDHLSQHGHTVELLGPCEAESCDYPDVTWPVAVAVAAGEADRGVLICGTGIGASIAANKVPGIRAALVHDEHSAEMSRRHNDANVLCLPADSLSNEQAGRIAEVWLEAPFDGGRHERRVRKISAMERGENPVGEEVTK
jgi:ribose 5-phosphate isomerase B